MNMEKNCCNCCWHDSFSWVCFNGRSANCADVTDPEDTCKEWEDEKKNETETV